ncbi:hypothetical protein [Pyxidicoccus trucidator]|uniref:hypothetical protein n=1 Tax=Pyxidicoccus trucidator TaxID=2709662 RepID=UPI0013DA8EC2|nr:hypothetical protein [Pyxidicoccus trucidator]
METDNNSTPSSALELSLDQVHKRILKLVEQGHRSAYQIGRLYNYVVDSELAQKDGFKDARDFFQQKVKVLGQSVLSRNGAVARTFPEAIALKYGMSNLYTLLTYAKLAGLTLDHDEPGATPVAVSQEDGALLTKPFSECTVDELQGAVNHKRAPQVPLPEEDAARVQRYRDSLQRHFTEKLSIRVDARSHMGELYISLRNIPEKEMRRLVAALAEESTSRDTRAQGSSHRDTSELHLAPAAQAPVSARTPLAPVAQPKEVAHDDGPTAAPPSTEARFKEADTRDSPVVPLSPLRDSAQDGPSAVLPPLVAQVATTAPTQGTAHNDSPAVPATAVEQPRGPAYNDNVAVRPTPVVQQPAMTSPAFPAMKAPTSNGTTPTPGVAAVQGQNGPRNKSQGLGGFLRRMTGG